MKEQVITTWTRTDTYKGHSKINHYNIPCKMVCMFVDFPKRELLELLSMEKLFRMLCKCTHTTTKVTYSESLFTTTEKKLMSVLNVFLAASMILRKKYRRVNKLWNA